MLVVPSPGMEKTYDVFEALSQKYSDELSSRWLLDTSYLADESIAAGQTHKAFRSTAPNNEIVSVLVVPDVGATTGGMLPWLPKRMNFDLEVVTEHGTEIVSSKLKEKVNLVQFQIRKGEKFEVRVKAQGQGLFFEPQKFRIVVSGAAAHYNGYLWEDVLGKDIIDI